MSKQTRNRRPAPRPGTIGSLTLEQWRASNVRLSWAQNNPQFVELVTVLINERTNRLNHCNLFPGEQISEGQFLGIHRGYDAALEVLKKMQGAAEPPQQAQDDQPTYPAPEESEQVSDV